MNQKEITAVAGVALVFGIFTLLIAGAIFKGPSKKESVPAVPSVTSTLPDVRNDAAYKSFFNNQALDPTQSVQIGNSQNNSPFSP